MSWPAARQRKAAAFCGGLMVCALGAGCAQQAGAIFKPIAKAPVWPAAPQTARIKYVGVITGSGSLNAGRSGIDAFQAAFVGDRRPINFGAPHSVAVEGSTIAVADVGVAGVHVLDLATRTHTLITGWAEERFDTPIGVCIAGDRVYVTDAGRHEVIAFGFDGSFKQRIGADQLTRPVGITYVASRDALYVVDGGSDEVVCFARDGRETKRIGGSGNQPGTFNRPTHIAWNGADLIAVADSANFRVQLLDLDGTFKNVIGRKGDGAGDFSLPKGVAFDREGHLYVVDAQFENVQLFNTDGALLLAFGSEGQDAGHFALPAGMTIDNNNRIWIADSSNHRIQVFDFLGSGA